MKAIENKSVNHNLYHSWLQVMIMLVNMWVFSAEVFNIT